MFTGNEEQAVAQTIIKNAAFWPDIVLEKFKTQRRIPSEYDDQQQIDSLKLAAAEVNMELMRYELGQQAQGINQLTDTQGPMIDGEPVALTQYMNAVYSRAKAKLLNHFATVNRKPAANNEAKESQDTFDRLLAESQQAIRAILGKHRVTVGLI